MSNRQGYTFVVADPKLFLLLPLSYYMSRVLDNLDILKNIILNLSDLGS